MPVSFDALTISETYSRNQLASLWGYVAYQALARGVVTPKGDSKIILFVTAEKQESALQYKDKLQADTLHWEGPNDHFAEERMLKANDTDDEIHLFYRTKHHTDFTYYGKISVETVVIQSNRPSQFTFRLAEYV